MNAVGESIGWFIHQHDVVLLILAFILVLAIASRIER